MPFRWSPREHVISAAYVGRWTVLCVPMAMAVGSACALFLWLLDVVTTTRYAHPSLLFGLPLAGVLVAVIYRWAGKSADRGNNLIMEEIHEPGGGVPLRMAPLVLGGTIITHLFGGSAGREGTAVQMGGAFAGAAGRWLRLSPADVSTLLMAGIAAGFGAVFGTPVTGAIFAMEVLAVGRIRHNALVPCLIAALAADWTCSAWGIHHTAYHINVMPRLAEITAGDGVDGQSQLHLNPLLLLKAALAALGFGLASVLFAEATHGLHAVWQRLIKRPLLRPVLGGLAVIGLTYALGTRDYLGLGVTSPDPHAVTIVSCFREGGATSWSWFWKLLFTAVTLSAGFKGGEVTPLFFVGAALGNTLGRVLGGPVDLFAGLGFVAVFAGATNTPLACTVMGIELFGAAYAPYFAVACFTAYLMSGHSGVYLSQKIGVAKVPLTLLPADATLKSVREARPSVLKAMYRILLGSPSTVTDASTMDIASKRREHQDR